MAERKIDAPATLRGNIILEEFAPYRIVALGHAISQRMAKAYEDENISIPEWRVLAVIAQHETVAARDVVRRTPMDKMSVSRAVTSLEQKGIVERTPDPADRRVSAMSLSVEGRQIFDRIATLALAYEQKLLSSLSDDEAEKFSSALSKLEYHVQLD
ncbi:MarR family transcriptional regulator [Hyphococcus formosus]|uniref:MarR family winged helix-turn-helix transcriptional regulator n=1 Tax=Hyphococcus formosus TaxID=3143534 RepID=UPI00398B8169